MEQLIGVQRELPSIAAARLREMIVNTGMQAGDRCPSESELMRMFGVSRSTVREAVKLLVAENVVEIRRGRGTFVTSQPGLGRDPLGLHFADQNNLLLNLLETRMVIEPQVAYLAALRATPENIQRIEGILRTFEETPDITESHAALDIRFHTAIAECTQNDVLHRVLPIICESIREGYYETVTIEGSHQRARKSHMKILEAIKNRCPEKAKSETEKHIQQTAQDAKLTLGGIER